METRRCSQSHRRISGTTCLWNVKSKTYKRLKRKRNSFDENQESYNQKCKTCTRIHHAVVHTACSRVQHAVVHDTCSRVQNAVVHTACTSVQHAVVHIACTREQCQLHTQHSHYTQTTYNIHTQHPGPLAERPTINSHKILT